MTGLIAALRDALGDGGVLTGDDAAPWSRDWTGQYRWTPLCVVRPRNTAEVSDVLRLCHAAGQPVVPVSGNTGLSGGTAGEGAVIRYRGIPPYEETQRYVRRVLRHYYNFLEAEGQGEGAIVRAASQPR